MCLFDDEVKVWGFDGHGFRTLCGFRVYMGKVVMRLVGGVLRKSSEKVRRCPMFIVGKP